MSDLANIPELPRKVKVHNENLIEKWQDWVLANSIVANYLNTLLVLTSRQDFPFTIPADYSPKYVQDLGSFLQAISQLSTEIRVALTGAREDLNRVHTGMKEVPGELVTMAQMMKQADYDLLSILFPDSFKKIENLVNNSLIVLRKPKQNFEQVLNLLTEIDFLLTVTPTDQMIALQVSDVKTQWTFLTELINELAEQAEIARISFLYQFNWVLQGMLLPGMPFDESIRNWIILFLMPKIIELDQTSDLLGIVTGTYTDISVQYTDEQISGYGNLLLLTDENIRKQYLKEFRYELPPVTVQFARLALKRHDEFLQRDQNRQEKYE